jgi:glycosyltransferase involved in cell wall biosynthesis
MITIVTVNYNNGSGLLKTIESVFEQNIERTKFQFVIIDGDSTDCSKKHINDYLFDNVVSEQDHGIFDAMNKGISLSEGKHVLFLNSGDVFYDKETLLKLYITSDEQNDNSFIFGRVQVSSGKGWMYPPLKYNNTNIDKWLKTKQPHHQACLFPREFYSNNLYKKHFKVAGDLDYKLMVLDKANIYFLDEVVSIFDYSGISSDVSNFRALYLIYKELNGIYKLHGFGFLYRITLLGKYITKYLMSLINKKFVFNFLRLFYK